MAVAEAIAEAAADAAVAAAAASASIVALVGETAAGIAADAIMAAIPGLSELGTVGGCLIDASGDILIDTATSTAERIVVRRIADKVIAKASGKFGFSYHNLMTAFSKSYERTAKTASVVKIARASAIAAVNVCCANGTQCAQTMKIKCPPPEAGHSGLLGPSDGGSSTIPVAGSPLTWRNGLPSYSGVGASRVIHFPLNMICGDTPTTVHTFAAATTCYQATLRNLRLQIEMSKRWRNVAQHPCTSLLYGATEDPFDDYCTVFRVPYSFASFDTGINGTKRIYYSEAPFCKSMEEATRSMLLASKVLPPDGLIPFFWSPTENCDLPRPGVRVRRIGPPLPVPTDDDMPTIMWTVLWVILGLFGTVLLAAGINAALHLHTHGLIRELPKRLSNWASAHDEDEDEVDERKGSDASVAGPTKESKPLFRVRLPTDK